MRSASISSSSSQPVVQSQQSPGQSRRGGGGGSQQHNRKASHGHGHSHGPGPQQGLTAASSSSSSSASSSSSPTVISLPSLIGIELDLVLVAHQAGAAGQGKGKDSSATTSTTSSSSVGITTVSGRLWCYDAVLGCLVLSNPTTQSYRIVRLSSISSISVSNLPSNFQPATTTSSANIPSSTAVPEREAFPSLAAVDLNRVREREAQGVRGELRKLEREGPPGVSELGKELFDALGKTMGVRWAGKAM